MKKMRSITTLLVATTLVVLLAQAAVAAPSGNQAPMRITDVRFTDLNDATQIEVVGSQFDNGAFPAVTLDGAPINVTGASATLIQATLPVATADGEYTIGVVTGSGAKQSAEHGFTVAPLVGMSVPCIDWFSTAGHGEHIHNELHVEDEDGFAVLGAEVTYTTAFEGDVFQINVSATTKTAGHNHGEGCSDPAGEGVTGWFCCIGAGKFDAGGEVPGGRACPAGNYAVKILSVTSPPGTTLVWDGVTPAGDSIFFDPF